MNTDSSPALLVEHLSKSYGLNKALDDLTLAVASGEVRALLGENGSGKSTLIKVISGYHEPDSGSVTVHDRDLEFGTPRASYRLGCRFVHQDLGLIGNMSIMDNLALGSGFPTRLGTVRDRRAAAEAQRELERFSLTIDPHVPVESLPAAQRTGVAIVRALWSDPAHPVELLVLDEPTATLPRSETELLFELIRSTKEMGVAVLYVTHRIDEVFEIADSVSVLRDGKLIATTVIENLSRAALVDQLVGSEFRQQLTTATPIAHSPQDQAPI